MQPYPALIEAQMKRYYQSLSEKDRRRYAAIEAVKLGYGGQAYIRRLFGCHHETLALGLVELEEATALEQERIRQPGGGRKSAFETIAGLDTAFCVSWSGTQRVHRWMKPSSGLISSATRLPHCLKVRELT
ncbi:MAG: hypothetical protein CLLPBCKN_000456 [Chroococcidiopsis cubana SAG 39.79]|uniref:hypothetical protein n=1 Tax=Chroococcidiopsis cubana TaxID=171392 RepID=UPI002AC7C6B2|nr:hypothetical protein [Chroococcidiopsis cubana]MDZ4871068.1 hypothetical protein [Chroococcidiopsis cubana SAG 39.79]